MSPLPTSSVHRIGAACVLCVETPRRQSPASSQCGRAAARAVARQDALLQPAGKMHRRVEPAAADLGTLILFATLDRRNIGRNAARVNDPIADNSIRLLERRLRGHAVRCDYSGCWNGGRCLRCAVRCVTGQRIGRVPTLGLPRPCCGSFVSPPRGCGHGGRTVTSPMRFARAWLLIRSPQPCHRRHARGVAGPSGESRRVTGPVTRCHACGRTSLVSATFAYRSAASWLPFKASSAPGALLVATVHTYPLPPPSPLLPPPASFRPSPRRAAGPGLRVAAAAASRAARQHHSAAQHRGLAAGGRLGGRGRALCIL